MLRLWNSLSRGFRLHIRDTGVCNGPPPVGEQDRVLKVPWPNSPGPPDDQLERGERCKILYGPRLFHHVLGLSSVLVLGWRFRHSELGEGGRTSILDALAGVAAQRHRILSANRNEKQSVPQLPALHQESQYQAASAEPQEAHTDELQEIMAGLRRDLDCGQERLTAETLNDAGVELMAAAASGRRRRPLERLVPALAAESRRRRRHQLDAGAWVELYRHQAALCFAEARRLGSARGAFNLGLCYELGLGTDADPETAAACYAQAAAQDHAGAQLNLGLLHLERRLECSDPATGRRLVGRAADAGLEAARALLLRLRHRQPTPESESPRHPHRLCLGGC